MTYTHGLARPLVSTLIVDHVSSCHYPCEMITPEQCRAARALIDITQRELAHLAKIGESTVRDFEAGRRDPLPENLMAMRDYLEQAGVEFVADGETSSKGGVGVRLSRPRRHSRVK